MMPSLWSRLTRADATVEQPDIGVEFVGHIVQL
jgi:hypothetical protein